ncbi:hypothetical protein B0A48_18263 [Cryoendolithus antarcticus]|uniref:Uncharacterized protein n=1 Tax=Cryoendolithus antarcticus TaxID=1507870 RepID=A0A1V8S9I8_9PEZI|nr:hypothetical protein B0A48_18263 [Cryoendolithus antarcticus]
MQALGPRAPSSRLQATPGDQSENLHGAIATQPARPVKFKPSRPSTPVGPEIPLISSEQRRDQDHVMEILHIDQPRMWRAKPLHWLSLLSMAVVEIGIITALVTLLVLSNRRQGFVAIGKEFDVSLSVNSMHLQRTFGKSFLWTSLPAFLMTLLSLGFAAIVGSYSEELPYRNLHDGGSIDRTVCLDYRRYPMLYKYWPAWKNRNLTLGFGAFLAFLTTIVLVPLAAHLFQPVYPPFAMRKDFPVMSVYNASSPLAIVDYAPIIGIVAAVRVYGGNWPKWTDGAYAVAEHNRPQGLSSSLNLTELQISASGYAATLDCRSLVEYSLARNPPDGDTATLALDALDMGCNVSLTAGVGPGNEIYLASVSNTNCPEGSGISRIAFLAGRYSSSSTYLLEDMNVIACMPSYSQTSGSIVSSPGFDSTRFEPIASISEMRPDGWALFEKQLVTLSNIGNNNSPDFTSQFGQLILDVARSKNASLVLDTGMLLETIPSVFQSVYAVLARTRMFTKLPEDQPRTDTGLIIYSESRLATVSWSSDITIAIIAALTVFTIWLAVLVPRKNPMLAEEPRGILSGAALLANSDLQQYIREPEWREQYGGRLHKWLKRKFDLGKERCTMDEHGIIKVSGLKDRPPEREKKPSASSSSAA